MRASQRNRERDDVDPCVSVPNIQGPLYKEGERERWSGEGLRSRLQIWGMEGRNAYEEGNSTRSSHRGSTESYRVRCHRRIRSGQLASCMYMELKRSIEIATEPQTPIYTSAYTFVKMKTSKRKKTPFTFVMKS